MPWDSYYARNGNLVRLRRRHRRRTDVALMIVEDARKADRKKGRNCDLDVDFVRRLISEGCSYCGETRARMTADRVRNDQGHMKANVVAACERCNITRRDMPYAAWLVLAPAMRRAREEGLFGEWTGALHRRTPLPALPVKVAAPHGTLSRYKNCRDDDGRRCSLCRRAMADWKASRRKR